MNYEIVYPPSISTSVKLNLASLIPDPNADPEPLPSNSPERQKEPSFSETNTSGSNFFPLPNSEDEDPELVTIRSEQNFSSMFESIAEEQEQTGTCLEGQ